MARESLRRYLSKTALLAAVALSTCCISCSRSIELEKAYNFSSFNMDQVYSDGSLRAEPFAADLCVPDFTGDLDAEDVDAEGFLLFNIDTGEVISAHNIYETFYPASTTKVMTCLLALRNSNPDDMVTIPEDSDITVSGSSMANVKPGDRISMRDLLYGLMIPSGNDAAAAIACHISGSVMEPAGRCS